MDVAAQMLAALAAARRARELAELIGTAALSGTDRRYQALERAYERDLVDQASDCQRSMTETLDRAWRVLATLPRRELTMLPAEALDARYQAGDGEGGQDSWPPPAGRAAAASQP